MELTERILDNDALLAFIIRASVAPDRTTFISDPDLKQQVGFVVYPRGGEIVRHYHRPLERHIIGTSEVLCLRSGSCEVDFYGTSGKLVTTRVLHSGDVLCLVDGGHGFRMLQDTIFLEIKQGPYTGLDEKQRF